MSASKIFFDLVRTLWQIHGKGARMSAHGCTPRYPPDPPHGRSPGCPSAAPSGLPRAAPSPRPPHRSPSFTATSPPPTAPCLRILRSHHAEPPTSAPDPWILGNGVGIKVRVGIRVRVKIRMTFGLRLPLAGDVQERQWDLAARDLHVD